MAFNVDLTDYDFIDFGASQGGSMDFAKAQLGGRNGLGIDKDPAKVERLRQLGYHCIEADVTDLDIPPKSVRFVVLSHFLEHLPNLDAVRRTLECAAKIASDFLYVQGPYFDADEYLASHGLKFYWSDWHGHHCHVTSTQLTNILDSLALRDYVVRGVVPVVDSEDPCIHPASSPRNQHDYTPGKHPPKPSLTFDRPVYKEMLCLVPLRPLPYWRAWRALAQAHRAERLGGTRRRPRLGWRPPWRRASRRRRRT